MKTITVNVAGHDLVAMANEVDGKQWVAMRPIFEAVGIDSYRQLQKLQTNPQFSCQHMLSTLEVA